MLFPTLLPIESRAHSHDRLALDHLLHFPADVQPTGTSESSQEKTRSPNHLTSKTLSATGVFKRHLAEQKRARFDESNSHDSFIRSKSSRRGQGLRHGPVLLDEEERAFLEMAPDPVLAIATRIMRAVATRHAAGGVNAPSPIVSRIFQELSNGMVAFNQATKMKEVPVPFAYVQFHALLVLTFTIVSSLAIGVFTPSVVLAVVISCLVIGGFTGMWLVANELEDPFGFDPNDLPVIGYHEHFVRSLCQMLQAAWVPRDEWSIRTGVWVAPPGGEGLAQREPQSVALVETNSRGAGPPYTASPGACSLPVRSSAFPFDSLLRA